MNPVPPSARKAILTDAQLKIVIAELDQLNQEIPCPLTEVFLRVGELQPLPLRTANRSGPFKDAISGGRKTRLFRIASLGKIFINLAFCRVLLEECRKQGRHLDGKAFETYGSVQVLGKDMQIIELLLHTKGFVDMNRDLLGPDGTFMFSSPQELIDIAILLSNNEDWGYKYSAVNHIFAALILEKITKKPITEVIQEYVIDHFDLKYTTLYQEQLEKWEKSKEAEIIRGYQATADLSNVIGVPDEFLFRYMSSSLEQAFLGFWSNVEDLDKLFYTLFRAFHQEDNSKLSWEAAKQFFALVMGDDTEAEQHTLAGVRCPLKSSHDARESPNSFLTEPDSPPIYELGKPAGKRTPKLTYKGAAMTGYTGTWYFDLHERLFLIVLGNMSGPIDITPFVAHIILQQALYLFPPVNIAEAVGKNKDRLLALPIKLEEEERNAAQWPRTNFLEFVGTYESRVTKLIMEVTDEEKVIFKRGSISTEAMPFRTDGEKKMRIFPGRDRQILDRLGCWRDLTFNLVDDGIDVTLVGYNGAERYVKQNSG